MRIQKIKIFLTSFFRYCKDIAGYFRHAWPNLSKNIASTCRTFISMQKINFITHFFLEIFQRYCIFTLNTLGIYVTSIYVPTCKNLWCLSAPNINFIPHFFFGILHRLCKLVIWGTLSMTGLAHQSR